MQQQEGRTHAYTASEWKLRGQVLH